MAARLFEGEEFSGVFLVLFSGVWKRRRINYNLPSGKSIFAKTDKIPEMLIKWAFPGLFYACWL